MPYFIIGSLFIILISLSINLFLKDKAIKRLTYSLRNIRSKESRENLRLGSPSKSLENLVEEINIITKENKNKEEEYKKKDLELRDAIANMSHDLRTPLTSIMGYVYLLKEDELSEKEKNEYIGIIEKRSEVLNDLITNFYSLSRIQADQYEVKLEPVKIELILGEIIAAFYESLYDNFGEPTIEIEEEIGVIAGDKQCLNRIFTNLIENMIKHGEGNVKISLREKNNKIITEFSNKATFLKDKDVHRIFEKFFTIDRMRTGQNTGLGLAIVKLLVEKQGHNIEAEKNEDRLIIRIIWNKDKC